MTVWEEDEGGGELVAMEGFGVEEPNLSFNFGVPVDGVVMDFWPEGWLAVVSLSLSDGRCDIVRDN